MADYYVLSQLKDDVSWVVYRRRTFITCTLSAEKIRRLADFLGTEVRGDRSLKLPLPNFNMILFISEESSNA
jgi:hypothetical protein